MSNAAQLLKPNFRHRPRSLGGGLYRWADGTFAERPWIDGKRKGYHNLAARTEKLARLELAKKRSDQALAPRGLAADPYARVQTKLTLSELAGDYLEAKCPKRNGQARSGKQLAEEQRRVRYLVEHLSSIAWDKLTVEDWNRYHSAREADRAVDLEWVTLNAIYRYAVIRKARTGVAEFPIKHRIVFRDPDKVRHCRECMPENAEELHRIAAALFQDPQSHALGWQFLFEAFIGHRTNELLRLRWDASRPAEPGFIERTEKGVPKILYLYSSRGHKGAYGHIDAHAALRLALDALRAWRDEHFPKSPWFFPSHRDEGRDHVDPSSLTKALARVCKQLGLPHRTGHGARSYFVNVLRSDRDAEGNPKLSDAEIALRVGQKTAGREIIDVYGSILPYRLTWLPKNKEDVAWRIFTVKTTTQLEFPI